MSDINTTNLVCDLDVCTFTKPSGANWRLAINQDVLIPGVVGITRDDYTSIFNALDEKDYQKAQNGEVGPPSGTAWAFLPEGKTIDFACGLTYCPFTDECFVGWSSPTEILGRDAIVRVDPGNSSSNVYYNIKFTVWEQWEGGEFSYIRDKSGSSIECPNPFCDAGVCTFTKPPNADWKQEKNQDILVLEKVGITRDYDNGLFNSFDHFDYFKAQNRKIGPPRGTSWAFLPEGRTLDDACELEFCSFTDECFAGNHDIYPHDLVDRKAVLRVNMGTGVPDLYYNMKFTHWEPRDSGAFTYERDADATSIDCPNPHCESGFCIFTKPKHADWRLSENRDELVPGVVGITRAYDHGLFNTFDPFDYFKAQNDEKGPPSGTAWAFLPEGRTVQDACELEFCHFTDDCFVGHDNPGNIVGRQAVVRVDPGQGNSILYYRIMLTNWAEADYWGHDKSGAFAYIRDESGTELDCPSSKLVCKEGLCTFTKPKDADWRLEENQDELVPGLVGITRTYGTAFFNPLDPLDYFKAQNDERGPPSGTAWAFLREGRTVQDACDLTFCSFTGGCFAGRSDGRDLVGEDAVLRVNAGQGVPSLYYHIMLTYWESQWENDASGAFAYMRDENGTELVCPNRNLVCEAAVCTFTKPPNADWTLEENQDELVPGVVAITRDYYRSIFNALDEDDYQKAQNEEKGPPSHTAWALLPQGKNIQDAGCDLVFCSFMDDCFAGSGYYNNPQAIMNRAAVVRVDPGNGESSLYFNIKFISWGPESGAFAYERDKNPVTLDFDYSCPICTAAYVEPAVLAPATDEMADIEVFVPDSAGGLATVEILAIEHYEDPCSSGDYELTPLAEKNLTEPSKAKIRRSRRHPHMVQPRWYGIHFTARTLDGSCRGTTGVCVSGAAGLPCEQPGYFDAFAVLEAPDCCPPDQCPASSFESDVVGRAPPP